jgi:hypothetical protein
MEMQGYLYRARDRTWVQEGPEEDHRSSAVSYSLYPVSCFRPVHDHIEDVEQRRQVVQLSMASKAQPSNGSVTVSVEKVPNNAQLESPEVNQVDHLIRGYEGATIVLETMRSRLQAAKEQKSELPHERLKRLEEELDWHQHENDFYGICYDIYQRLYLKVIEVSQDIILQSFFEPRSTPNGDPFLYDALRRLNTAIKESQIDENQAEVAWKGYWSIPKTVDPSSSWI